MKKRLAILALTAVTALSAIGSASAAVVRSYGPPRNAPAASCGAGDTACKMPSTAQAGPPTNSQSSISSSQSYGTGYHVG
jgi:hypothetical protein